MMRYLVLKRNNYTSAVEMEQELNKLSEGGWDLHSAWGNLLIFQRWDWDAVKADPSIEDDDLKTEPDWVAVYEAGREFVTKIKSILGG
jgi:hypothetical protein